MSKPSISQSDVAVARDKTQTYRPARLLVSRLGVPCALVLAATIWFGAGRRQIAGFAKDSAELAVERGEQQFRHNRSMVQAQLRTAAQLLAEDSRIRSVLATQGIDGETLTDVLNDLHQATGLGMLAVASTSGRILAEVGGPQYRAADLSTSTALKLAKEREGTVSSTWVSGDQIHEVVVIGLRVGPRPLGFLIVGAAIDAKMIDQLAQSTGTGLVVMSNDRVVLASGASVRAAADLAAATSVDQRTLILDSERHVARVFTLEGSILPVAVGVLSPLHRYSSSSLLTLFWFPLAAVFAFTAVAVWRTLFQRSPV